MSDQEKNISSIAKTIADHLGFAWNYYGTLRGLQHYTRECPTILDRHGHFIATIHRALWDVLFLKLNHCSDTQKKATGFPKLFKQIRTSLKEDKVVLQMVDDQEQRLNKLAVRGKVEKWRNNIVAHHN